MFNKHARVHVIKHIQSSTMYGINNESVVCFHEKSHAKQIRKSLIKYKQTYKRNPDPNKLCVYKTDQLENCINDINAIEYGLLILDVNLENLLINLSTRHRSCSSCCCCCCRCSFCSVFFVSTLTARK